MWHKAVQEYRERLESMIESDGRHIEVHISWYTENFDLNFST